jgi:hypothetical protein
MSTDIYQDGLPVAPRAILHYCSELPTTAQHFRSGLRPPAGERQLTSQERPGAHGTTTVESSGYQTDPYTGDAIRINDAQRVLWGGLTVELKPLRSLACMEANHF